VASDITSVKLDLGRFSTCGGGCGFKEDCCMVTHSNYILGSICKRWSICED